MKKLRKNKGFTIVELIVVMAIIAILILIAVPTLTKYLEDANNTSELGSANAIYKSAISTIVSESVADDVLINDVVLGELEDSIVDGVAQSFSDGDITVDTYASPATTWAKTEGKWTVYFEETGDTTNAIDPAGDIYIVSPDGVVYKNGAPE